MTDKQEVRIPLERPVSLLVYLAVRGAWVDRRELAFFYRPDAPEERALSYLRQLIHRARSYPWAEALEVEADAIRWSVDSDVAAFTAAVERQAWSDALAIYGGPFLGGATVPDAPGFAAWQELEMETLEAAWLRSSGHRASELETEGRLEDAIAFHRSVLAHDQFAEANVQALLRLLGASGERTEALAIFDAFRRSLEEELRASPMETTEALADALRRRVARVSTVPAPGTPLVGRRTELATLRDLLAPDDSRLVTILGLGGSGKTRMAIEMARTIQAEGGEVHFVSLTAATSVDSATAAIMECLELDWQGEDAESALIDGLRSSEALLVLDNFEGAIDAAPLLARLLEAAPRLRLLVTSREPLQIHGERLLDLSGLEVPPTGTTVDVTDYESVQLFTQHAGRIAPWLAPNAADLEAIAEICRQLDGLPLAIELAASWSRVLSPRELLVKLAHDPKILTSTRRDTSPRHASLWLVFDHVWERLDDQERTALPRLALFEGGFDLEAATAMTGSGLDLLLRLMDLRLIRRTGPGRFALHQLVRQYSLQRLSSSALEVARRDHSLYFCTLLGRLGDELLGSNVKAGLERMNTDLDNFMAAWTTALARSDVAALDSAREAFDHYFYYRGRFATAIEVFGSASAALSAAEGDGARRVAARLILHRADHERHRGRLPLAQELATQALTELEATGDELDVAYARMALGNGAMRLSDYDEARDHFNHVLAVAEGSGDLYLQGAAHNGLATLISYTAGDIASAEEHYRASLRAHRRLGNLEGINGALINLGACRYDAHDFDGAERLWEEAAQMAAALGYKQREAVLHNNLGSIYEARGDLDGAKARFERSLALRREIGDVSGEANVLHNLGRLASTQDRLAEARRHLDTALHIYLEIDERAGVTHTRSRLARVLAASGLGRQAREQARMALETALDIDSRADILGSLLTVAILQKKSGKTTDAAALAQTVAGAAAGSHEPLRVEAEAVIERAGKFARTIQPVSAARLVKVARRELSLLADVTRTRPSA